MIGLHMAAALLLAGENAYQPISPETATERAHRLRAAKRKPSPDRRAKVKAARKAKHRNKP